MIRTLTKELCRDKLTSLVDLVADQPWAWFPLQFLEDRPRKWELSFIYTIPIETKPRAVIGVAIVSQPEDDRIHLHLLAIKPEYRNERRGSEMMQELIKRADGKQISLKVPHGNHWAMAFYRRHGFNFQAEWVPMIRAGQHVDALAVV